MPLSLISSPPSRPGDISIKAEISCELTEASTSTFPPFKRHPYILTGAKPSVPRYSISAPIDRRASTSGFIGRLLSRASPPMAQLAPGLADMRAIINLKAAPEAAQSNSVKMSFEYSARFLPKTAVSAQSGSKASGTVPSISHCRAMARMAILLLCGRATVASSISSGGKMR